MKTLQKLLERSGRHRFIDIRERHSFLRRLEGWYDAPPYLPKDYKYLWWEYRKSQSTLKFTRWLARNNKLDNKALSKLGKTLTSFSFKVSINHKDLLRLADSPHYRTCYRNLKLNGRQMFYYLSDPDVCVIYVPDKAGHFKWRCIARVILSNSTKGLGLLLYRPYGNADSNRIVECLAERTSIYTSSELIAPNLSVGPWTSLKSATILNNPVTARPIWSDSSYHMKGTKKAQRMILQGRRLSLTYA